MYKMVLVDGELHNLHCKMQKRKKSVCLDACHPITLGGYIAEDQRKRSVECELLRSNGDIN